nr:MAG: polyprotein [Posavirus sp.]
MIPPLIKFINENFTIDGRKLNGVWNKSADPNFFTGYKGEEVVIWDEFLNVIDQKAYADDITKMLSICSNTPYFPPMASVEESSSVGVKGTPFRPVVIVTLNNTLSVSNDRIDIERALLRRRNVCLVLHPNPDYADHFNNGWHFSDEYKDIVAKGEHIFAEFYPTDAENMLEPTMQVCPDGSCSGYEGIFRKIKEKFDKHLEVNKMFNPHESLISYTELKKQCFSNMTPVLAEALNEANQTFDDGDIVTVINNEEGDKIPKDIGTVKLVFEGEEKFVTFMTKEGLQKIPMEDVVDKLGVITNLARKDETNFDKEDEELTDSFDLIYRENVAKAGCIFNSEEEKEACIDFIKQRFPHHIFSACEMKYIRSVLNRVYIQLSNEENDEYYFYVDISGLRGWGWKLCQAVSAFFNFKKVDVKIPLETKKKWLFQWNIVGADPKTIEYPVLGLRLEWWPDKREAHLFIPREFQEFMYVYHEDVVNFGRGKYGDRLQSYFVYSKLKDNKKSSSRPAEFTTVYVSDVYKAILNSITKYCSCKGSIFSSTFKERPEELKFLVYDLTSVLLSRENYWVGHDQLKKDSVIRTYCGIKCKYLGINFYDGSTCPLLNGVLFENEHQDGTKEYLYPVVRGGPVKYVKGQVVDLENKNATETPNNNEDEMVVSNQIVENAVKPEEVEEVVPLRGDDKNDDGEVEAHVTNFSSPFYINGLQNLERMLEGHSVDTTRFYDCVRNDDWCEFFKRLGYKVTMQDIIDSGINTINGGRVFKSQNELYLIDLTSDLFAANCEQRNIAQEEVVCESVSPVGVAYYLNSDENVKVRRYNSSDEVNYVTGDLCFSPDMNTFNPIPARVFVCYYNQLRFIYISTEEGKDDWKKGILKYVNDIDSKDSKLLDMVKKVDSYQPCAVIFVGDKEDRFITIDSVVNLSNEQKRICTHFFNIKVPYLTYKYYEILNWVRSYCNYVKTQFKGRETMDKVLKFILGNANAEAVKEVCSEEQSKVLLGRAQAWSRVLGTATAFIGTIVSVGYFIWQKNDKKEGSAPVLCESWDTKCQSFNSKRERLVDEDEVVSTKELKRRRFGLRSDRVEPEAYQLTSVKIEINEYETYGIALYGNYVITHYHTLHPLIATYNGSVSCTIKKLATGEVYKGSLEVDDVNVLMSADLICFRFDCASWPPIRQNLSCFLTKADYFQVNVVNVGRRGFIVKDSTKYGFEYSLSKAGIHYDFKVLGGNEVKSLYIKEFLLYEVDSKPGWCGNVVKTVKNGTEYVVGLHVAGKDVSCDCHNGFATLLFRERVEALIGLRLNDGLVKECIGGKVDAESKSNLIECYDAPADWNYFVPNNSKLHLSPAGEDEIFENTVEPAILDKRDSRSKGKDPFDYGTECLLENEQATVDELVLDKVKRELIKKISEDNMVRMKPRVLTLDEAICGIPGKLTPMNSKSGIGYPSKTMFSSKKKDMFDFEKEDPINPDFRLAMDDYNRKWLAGEIHKIYVEAFLKDELQKHSKVDECRTRMIYCFDTMFNILTRQRFGYALLILNNLRHEIATGMNSASKDFDLDIYRYLEEVIPQDCPEEHFVAGDYKSFDLHMQSTFKQAAFDVIYSLLETFISKDEWNRYVELANHPHVRIRNKVYVFKSANFSGNIFTTVINDLVNSLMMRYLFALKYPDKVYDECVRAVFCGDDHILSVNRKEVDFNGVYIAEQMKTLNQIYTSDIKDAEIEEYRKFEDISFLGCVPVKHLGYYVGALKKSTLESHLLWIRDDSYFDALVDAFVHFASLHGRDYYLAYTQKIYEVYNKRNRSFYFLPYDAVVYQMVNNSAYYGSLIAESIVTNSTSIPEQVGLPYETSLMNNDEDNVGNDVGQIATNFLYKTNFSWKSTQAKGAVVAKYNLLELCKMGRDDPQATMFRQFLYFSSDFRVRVMTNGSPFQQGLLRVVYVPYNDNYNVRLSDIYNFRGVDINPKGSDDVVLDIPFTYNTPLARTNPLGKPDTVPTTQVSNYNSVGSIYFVVVSPLAFKSGKDVTVSIYLALDNPNFQVPIPLVASAESATPPISLSAPNPWGVKSSNKPQDGPKRGDGYIVLQRKKGKKSARRFGGKRQEKNVVKGVGKPVTNKRHKNAYLYKIDRKNKKLKKRFLKGDMDIGVYAACTDKAFYKRKADKYKDLFISTAQIFDNCEGWSVSAVVNTLTENVKSHMHLNDNYIKAFYDKIYGMMVKKDPREIFECDEETLTYIMNVLKLMMFFDKPMDFDLYPAVTKYPTLCNNVTRVPCYDMQLLPGAVQAKGRLALATDDTNIQRLLNYQTTEVVSWDTTKAVNSVIYSFPCNSWMSDGFTGGDDSSVPQFVMNQFKYWSSDIELKMRFVKTSFHTGRLRVTVGYGCSNSSSAQNFRNSSFTTIVDVNPESDEATVVIPYLSMFDMLETVYCNNATYSLGDTNSFGYVIVEVANTLNCSVDTVKNSIDIIVNKRFINSRVCVPRSVSLINTSACEINVTNAVAESEVVNESEQNNTNDVEVVNPTEEDNKTVYNGDEALVQGNLIPDEAETNPYQVTSVYDVLRRYTIVPPSGYSYELSKSKKLGNLTFRMNFSSNFDDLFVCKSGGLNVRIFTGPNARMTLNYVPTYYGREEYVYRTGMFNSGGENCSVDKTITYDGIRPYHAVEKSYYSGNESWIDVHLPFQSIVDFGVYSYYGNMVATLFSNETLPDKVEMWISAGDDYTVGVFVPPEHYYSVRQSGISLTSNEFFGDILFRS